MQDKEGVPRGVPLPQIEGVKLDPVGLEIEDDALNVWRWEDALRSVNEIESATPWWIGDLLAFGEQTWDTTYAEVAEKVGLARQTIKNRVSVARNVPRENRVLGLSWAVHREVAKLPADEQPRWLEHAKAGGWSAETLRDEIKKDKSEQPDEPKPEQPEADEPETTLDDFCCPKCGHEWSGNPRPDDTVIVFEAVAA